MNKKYLFLLIIIGLGIIFTSFILITEPNNKTNLSTLVNVKVSTPISFCSSWAGYDTKAKEISRILSEFEQKNPNYEIINNSIGGEDFLLSLKTDFASGNAPDVFGLWPGSDINMLIKTGKVADLTEVLRDDPQWYNSFNEDSWQYVTVDGKIYGLPFETIYEGLFINEELFMKYSVPIPGTFEELISACREFRKNGIVPIAYSDTAEGSFVYQNIVMMLGGKEDVEDPFDENGHIKPCFIEGMYYMRELYEVDAFPYSANRLSDYDRNQLFLEGKAAMIVQGSWFVGDGALSVDEQNVKVIHFPEIGGAKASSKSLIYGFGNGVFYMSQSAWDNEDKRQICIQLLKTITSKDTALRFIMENGCATNIVIPVVNEAPNMYKEAVLLLERTEEFVSPVDSCIDRGIWEELIVEQFDEMLRGEISPEEIFDEVEEANSKIQENQDNQ